MTYSKEEMIRMYQGMVLGRVYCQGIEAIVMRGKIIGAHHLSYGQEAIGVGVRTAMKPGDWFGSTHRNYSGNLWHLDLRKFAAEQFGKVTGYNYGFACDSHISSPEDHHMFKNGVLGQDYAINTGVALSQKYLGTGQVVVAIEGDGAIQAGITYESWAITDTLKLPMVYVIEDNGYAISYPSSNFSRNFAERGSAFNLHSVTIDGNDVLAVREAVEAAIEKARNFEPCVVECKTSRWEGHFVGGDSQVYRDKGEIEEAKKNDPITRFEKVLFDLNLMTEAEKKGIWDKCKADTDDAIQFALDSEYPSAEMVLDYKMMYVNPWEV